MDTLYTFVRLLHIAAGSLSLLTGMVAMCSSKGGRVHRRSGKLYVQAMTVVCITALLLSLLHPNFFLFVIGVFSFHLCYSGSRSVQHRSAPNIMDWLVYLFTAAALIVMWYMGISNRNIVLLVFAFICTVNIGNESRYILGFSASLKKSPLHRILGHIGRMTGSLIAAWTAVLVNNIHPEKWWFLPWLLPTVIGGVVITVYIRLWKQKLLPAHSKH